MSYFDFRFEFGKHAGEPLHGVPLSYLRWAVKNMDSLSENDRATIRREILRQEDRRRDQGDPNYRYTPPPAAPPIAVDAAIGLEIVKLGRREFSKRCHPDVGGDPEKMTKANATADYLEKRLSLLLGAGA